MTWNCGSSADAPYDSIWQARADTQPDMEELRPGRTMAWGGSESSSPSRDDLSSPHTKPVGFRSDPSPPSSDMRRPPRSEVSEAPLSGQRSHVFELVKRADVNAQKNVKALIIDDHPVLRKAIARVIKPLGYDVTFAQNVADALTEMMLGSFDLVISDIKMPGLDGIQLLRHIRDNDDDLPVILITGDPNVESAAAAVDLGASCYMSKPFNPKALQAAARKAVARREVRVLRRMQRSTMRQERQRVVQAIDATSVAFQPIVDRHRIVIGHGVLARCALPEYEMPAKLFVDAEHYNLVTDLGRRVREMALANKGERGGITFIKVHPWELNDLGLGIELVAAGIANMVVLEITERGSRIDFRKLRTRIDHLRTCGFRIAVDDLGSGGAALSSILELEPEFVKLDRQLIRGVNDSERRRSLIGSILAACDNQRITAIAECIEQEAEFEALKTLGCQMFQGYLFGRPQP